MDPTGHNDVHGRVVARQALLASPTLLDPNFVRTCTDRRAHRGGRDGPRARPLGGVDDRGGGAGPAWLAGDEEQVYVGGLVAETAVIVLAELTGRRWRARSWSWTSASSGPTPTTRGARGRDRRARGVRRPRGWGPGQLEGEPRRRRGSSSRRSVRDVHGRGDGLWAAVLRRKAASTPAVDDAAGPVAELAAPQLSGDRAFLCAVRPNLRPSGARAGGPKRPQVVAGANRRHRTA